MIENKLLSICIPSYNRPQELIRLLNSIDELCSDEIEVVICEDKSPKSLLISQKVQEFLNTSKLSIKYYTNLINLGYDANLKELISKATGEYILFMGDDDTFVTENFSSYLEFLKSSKNVGYILRRYVMEHSNGTIEHFRSFNQDVFFKPGIEAFEVLFRKSVFISGFCFKRSLVADYYNTNMFNGTLLYQLFLCGNLIIEHPSAYCDILITKITEKERGIPEFGNSINESNKYTPGSITISNSINFMKSYLVITSYLEERYNLPITYIFKKNLSKYSYPVLSIQRQSGFLNFINYNNLLVKELNINCTPFYYLYYYSLLFFGKNFNDKVIQIIKLYLGKTPQL